MPQKTQYLELHRGRYRVVVSVPRELQAKLGTKLKRPLATDSLTTANAIKWPIVSELKTKISRERSGATGDPIRAEALELRSALAKAKTYDEADALHYAITDRAEQIAGPPIESDEVHEIEEPVFDPDQRRQAAQFARMARGEATPFDSFMDSFHAETARSIGTKADDVRALGLLQDWCRTTAIDPFIETFTSRLAGRFVSEALFPGKARKTINKYVSSLSAYWRWMHRKGYAEANPWREQSVLKTPSKEEDEPRAFTDQEVAKLIAGKPKQYMGPLMMIAALTGARIDAIVSLKVRDVQNGAFTFKPQKREKGRRRVPIHSSLASVVANLKVGKADEDDLFPELPPPPLDSERHRSNPAVQRFKTYRESLGIDDRVEGKRTSRVTFHSFRRWFITKAEQAGIAPHTISFVVGHKRPGTTLSVYSDGSSWEQMVECVEAVKLPEVAQEGQT